MLSKLDAMASAELGRAMDMIGRRNDAVDLLDKAVRRFDAEGEAPTDLIGNLAGRLKRRWIQAGHQSDARRAMEFYTRGYEAAKAASRPSQAFYHGINLAFMQWIYGHDREAAKATAIEVLEHCAAAQKMEAQLHESPDPWRLATQGEAWLDAGESTKAVENYRAAVAVEPERWQKLSMYEQAVLVVGATGNKKIAAELDNIFRHA